MTRRNGEADFTDQIVEHLLAGIDNGPGNESDSRLLAELEGMPDMVRRRVVQRLLQTHARLKQSVAQRDAALAETAETIQKLQQIITKLTAPPWHPAIFLQQIHVQGQEPQTTVAMGIVHMPGGGRRIVAFAGGIDPDCLEAGDEVLLSAEQNVIMQASPVDCLYSGELASFDRWAPDGERVILRVRDEEVVVRPVASLTESDPKAGDLVRWDRQMGLAFERFERSQGDGLFLEDTPRETFADIGGLDDAIERITNHLTLRVRHPEIANAMDYEPARAMLFVGPPGTGKTMLAKAIANYVGRSSRSGRSRFINVKPGSLNSMWHGQSEANYREVFRVARAAAAADPDCMVCIFFDEIDSVATARGTYISNTSDRILPAFMAELNGLEERGNILVIAATNRLDMLDSAVVRDERLGDCVIHIPRPGREAAREIMKRHFKESVVYAHNGEGNLGARENLIDTVVAAIYSPNGTGDLATIKFREGHQVPVRPADLVSGALIAGVGKQARYLAAVRWAKTGEAGLRVEDVLSALSSHYESAIAGLSPVNCRQRLDNVPADGSILAVEPVRHHVAHPIEFLKVA